MFSKTKLIILCATTLAISACGDDTSKAAANNGTNPNGNPGPVAPAAAINECKQACDQQKFFDCYDAAMHAGCYQDCDGASESGIELFVGCVTNDICDVECAINIQPATPPPVTTVDDCETACNTLVTEQCIPPLDCAAQCAGASDEEKAFLDYCESTRTGCEFVEACQFEEPEPPTPQEECTASCERLGFFQCITGTDVAACTTTCATLDDQTASSFNSCVSAGICQDDSCYALISEGGGSANVAGCKEACDDMAFFDCIDAGTLSTCRTTCDSASKDAVDSFIACNEGICEDDSCLVTLQSSL